jgi:hypothetical protein
MEEAIVPTEVTTPRLSGYEAHSLAKMFPPMSESDRMELLADIKQNGLINDIVLHEEQVLDGLNRQAICLELGVPPRYKQFADLNPKMTPFDYVVAQNFKRRHLTPSQKSELAATFVEMRQADPQSANLRSTGKASKEIAKLAGVSPRSIEHAIKVRHNGTAPLLQAVKDGDIAVSAAADIAELPAEKQDEIVKSHSKKVAATAAKTVREEKRGLSACKGFSKPFAWFGKGFEQLSEQGKPKKEHECVVIAFEPAQKEKAIQNIVALMDLGCVVHATRGIKRGTLIMASRRQEKDETNKTAC